ncbi:MAG: substrate-binding domain-containing protein [Salinibacter sp.]
MSDVKRRTGTFTRRDFLKTTAGSAAALGIMGTFGPVVKGQDFSGVTVNVITQTPPFVAKPVQMFAPEWEEMTGGKINLITAPFGDLFNRILSSLTLGGGQFDLMLHPAGWLGDLSPHLAPLDGSQFSDLDVRASDRLAWDDILSTYRERIANFGGNTFSVPLDGDLHIAYYRKDAIENEEFQKQFQDQFGYELRPPQTWQEYRDIAEFFHNKDFDGDGNKEAGLVEARRKDGQSTWTYFSRTAAFASPPDQPDGLFFDPIDMRPLINNPGHIEGLKNFRDVNQFGLAGIKGFDSGAIRQQFSAGKAALVIDWGDIGILAARSEDSQVKGKVGYIPLPGSDQYWDYREGTWVEQSNRPSYLAFGGWMGSVAANRPEKNIRAAYDFLTFIGSKEKSFTAVTTPETGWNPYRASHFEDVERWQEFGLENAEGYLNALRNAINNENAQVDLRIPGTQDYFEALDVQLSQVTAGSKEPAEALDAVQDEWERITNEQGREEQLKRYRASLGLDTSS